MAGRALEELLAAESILLETTRVRVPNTTLSGLFNWGLPARDPARREAGEDNPDAQGPNTTQSPLREFKYDIFDETDLIATGRVPDSPNSRQKPQKVGQVTGVIPRHGETIPLSFEVLNQMRQIGQNRGVLDRRGERYVEKQMAYLAKRFANLIEFQTAAMCRGSYTYDQQGDDLLHGFSGGGETVNFQVPDGNTKDLDMLGDGDIIAASWATASTDIPDDLFAINDAFIKLTGMGLAHVALTSVGWQYVVNNTKIQGQGGSANLVFETINRVGPGEFSVVLRAMPWLTWHIVDYRLSVWDGSAHTSTKLIADDHAIFLCEPNGSWAEYMDGMETVVEGPGRNAPTVDAFGYYPYAYPSHDPGGWNLAAVHNGIPCLYTPAAVAYGNILSGGT